MLYLEDKKKARLFEIIGIKEIEVKRILKNILEEYDNMIFREAHDIRNYWIIEYVIRFLNETSVVGKQGHRLLKEYEYIEK